MRKFFDSQLLLFRLSWISYVSIYFLFFSCCCLMSFYVVLVLCFELSWRFWIKINWSSNPFLCKHIQYRIEFDNCEAGLISNLAVNKMMKIINDIMLFDYVQKRFQFVVIGRAHTRCGGGDFFFSEPPGDLAHCPLFLDPSSMKHIQANIFRRRAYAKVKLRSS